MTTWTIQSNDRRRTWNTDVRAEAFLYAWISIEYCEYNVFPGPGGGCQPLIPWDIGYRAHNYEEPKVKQ